MVQSSAQCLRQAGMLIQLHPSCTALDGHPASRCRAYRQLVMEAIDRPEPTLSVCIGGADTHEAQNVSIKLSRRS